MLLVINAALIARNTTVSKYKFWSDSTKNFGHVEAKGENVRTRMIVKQFRCPSQEDKADSSYICITKGIALANDAWLTFPYLCVCVCNTMVFYPLRTPVHELGYYDVTLTYCRVNTCKCTCVVSRAP